MQIRPFFFFKALSDDIRLRTGAQIELEAVAFKLLMLLGSAFFFFDVGKSRTR